MYDAGVSPLGEGDERAQATGGAAEASTRAEPEADRLGKKRRRVERLAVGYFKRRGGSEVGAPSPGQRGDAVHVLNPEERRALRRIERNAVLRAGAAGAFAASLGAVVSVLARPLLGEEPEDATWLELLRYLAVTLMTALPVAIVELSFIYSNAIVSVHRLAEAAGVALFRPDDDSDDDSDEVFAAVLARAALEIPNPPRPMFGINPRREASRWRLVVATIVYKAKVSPQQLPAAQAAGAGVRARRPAQLDPVHRGAGDGVLGRVCVPPGAAGGAAAGARSVGGAGNS
jgi:hypothetical protein